MAGQGIVTRASKLAVAQTLDRLQALLQARGLTIFARIDHAGGAAQVGLVMPPSELLIFGSPRGGTPIMVAAPTAALDLPFKALAWQDAQGAVWLSYNDPAYLAAIRTERRSGQDAGAARGIARAGAGLRPLIHLRMLAPPIPRRCGSRREATAGFLTYWIGQSVSALGDALALVAIPS